MNSTKDVTAPRLRQLEPLPDVEADYSSDFVALATDVLVDSYNPNPQYDLPKGLLPAELREYVLNLRPVAMGDADLGERHLSLGVDDKRGRVRRLVLGVPP